MTEERGGEGGGRGKAQKLHLSTVGGALQRGTLALAALMPNGIIHRIIGPAEGKDRGRN